MQGGCGCRGLRRSCLSARLFHRSLLDARRRRANCWNNKRQRTRNGQRYAKKGRCPLSSRIVIDQKRSSCPHTQDMLLTPDRRLPRSRNLDSPFAMDILGEKGEWRVCRRRRRRFTAPRRRYSRRSSRRRRPGRRRRRRHPCRRSTARAARRKAAPPPPPVARRRARSSQEPGLVKVPPPVPDERKNSAVK